MVSIFKVCIFYRILVDEDQHHPAKKINHKEPFTEDNY